MQHWLDLCLLEIPSAKTTIAQLDAWSGRVLAVSFRKASETAREEAETENRRIDTVTADLNVASSVPSICGLGLRGVCSPVYQ